MSYFDSGREIVDFNGLGVEKNVLQFVADLDNYDPNLELCVLRPNSADFADAPYMIVETCTDGLKRKVFSTWELNEATLDRLRNADTRRTDVYGNLEKAEEQIKRNALQRYRDSMDEAKDILEHVLKHQGSRYSFPNGQGQTVVLDDTVGIVRKNGERTELGT